jgi:hypothetical protein
LIDRLKLGHPSSGAIDGMPDRMVKVSVTDWVFLKKLGSAYWVSA